MQRFSLKRLLASFLLALVLLNLTSCVFPSSTDTEYFTELSAPKALAPEGSALPVNENCRYVSDYVEYWGMPAFQKTKLIAVEKFYTDYFVFALPDAYTLAKEVYSLYREFFSERADIDMRVPQNVTAALITCLQEAAGDTYAVYMSKEYFEEYWQSFEGDYVGVGVRLYLDELEDRVFVFDVFEDSPAADAGITRGDIILSVNGIPLQSASYEDALAQMQDEAGTRVTLNVLREEESISLDLTLQKIESYSVSWRMLSEDDSIAYIRIEEFNAKTAEQFKRAYDSALAAGAEKLIFDLRDNPGGEINAIADVLDYLLADGGPIAHFRYRESSPLASENESFYADDGHASDLPMAVLCNENTASAGELFTAALRDYDVATIVGETTYGKGIMQNIIPLPDGTAFTVSVARYDPPYGENYEGLGIIPHISVSLPEDAIKTGSFLLNEEEDTQLQAAIGALNAPLV